MANTTVGIEVGAEGFILLRFESILSTAIVSNPIASGTTIESNAFAPNTMIENNAMTPTTVTMVLFGDFKINSIHAFCVKG